MLRIIFIGTVESSYAILQKLMELNANIVGVITRESSPYNADYEDLLPLCKQYGLPTRFSKNINNPEDLAWIKSLNPDVIFCFGWSSLIGKEALVLPRMGVIGFHPAELPKNRGRHPLVWALALGLTQTASSFFFMEEGADTGDILSQKIVPIAYEDTARTLYNKIKDAAVRQVEEFFPALEKGVFARISQDHSRANTWRKRSKADGWIDFRMSSQSIYNLVRALTRPYVGAHIDYQGREVKIWQVRETEVDCINFEPGKVLSKSQNQILVKCSDNAVWIVEHEFSSLPEIGDYL